MGRFPYLTWVNRYLENSGLADSTVVERRRRLMRIYRDLLELESKGRISTTNPEKMTEMDVGAFVDMMLAKGKRGKDFEHDISALNALLKHASNLALENHRARHANLFRRSTKVVRYPPLDEEEYGRILRSANMTRDEDWHKLESYAIVVLGLASGARHKELREGRMSDLCLRPGEECYHIEHPKGEDSYGEVRAPPLRPDCVPFLKRYLLKRTTMRAKRPDNEFLFPAFRDKLDGKLSANSITKMVRAVGREAQVAGLDLHKCRRTYGQMLLDEGAGIEEVSVLLGHATTAMTEKYYCRRRQQQASISARNLWGGNEPLFRARSKPDVKNPLIEKKKWEAGYA